MNINKLKNQLYLDKIFENVELENIENSDKHHYCAVQYYREKYLNILKKSKWLKEKWLYKEFKTKSLRNQKDHWILLGLNYDYNSVCIVWWKLFDNELLLEPLSNFKEDIKSNIYKIVDFKIN